MARRNPGITTDKVVQAAKLLSQTLGEDEAKKFAYENVKALYPELSFPDIGSNGTTQETSDRKLSATDISLINPVDTYIMKRLVKANGESVSVQQLYEGIKVHKRIKGQSLNYISDRLKALENDGYVAFEDGWHARLIN